VLKRELEKHGQDDADSADDSVATAAAASEDE
jgi:hypothetical protein